MNNAAPAAACSSSQARPMRTTHHALATLAAAAQPHPSQARKPSAHTRTHTHTRTRTHTHTHAHARTHTHNKPCSHVHAHHQRWPRLPPKRRAPAHAATSHTRARAHTQDAPHARARTPPRPPRPALRTHHGQHHTGSRQKSGRAAHTAPPEGARATRAGATEAPRVQR
jgi:hypothetical protein